jgi:hypothetical protein
VVARKRDQGVGRHFVGEMRAQLSSFVMATSDRSGGRKPRGEPPGWMGEFVSCRRNAESQSH